MSLRTEDKNSTRISVEYKTQADTVVLKKTKNEPPIPLVSENSKKDLTNTDKLDLQADKGSSSPNLTIESICNSMSILNIKLKPQECIKFLSLSNNITEKELLDSNPKDLQKYIEHVQKTINAMKEDGIELKPENIQYEARKYKLDIENGWDSIDSFRAANKKNSESITERLERYSGKSLSKMSTEEIAELIKKYFFDSFNTKDSVKKGINNVLNWIGISDKSNEKLDKELKIHKQTDFIKLLHNSSPEEFALLKDAIEYLDAENRLGAAADILKSFKEMNDAIKFAEENYDYEFINKNATKADINGNRPTDNEEKLTADISELRSYHGVEATKKYEQHETSAAIEFYQNNSDALADINKKLTQGLSLSKEEEQLYSQSILFTSGRAAAPIAILNNKNNFDNETKLKLLSFSNTNTVKITAVAGEEFYRKTIYMTSQYINNNTNELSVTIEEAVDLMNKATNGNYSIVLKDKKNNTKTELNEIDKSITKKQQPETNSETTQKNKNNNSPSETTSVKTKQNPSETVIKNEPLFKNIVHTNPIKTSKNEKPSTNTSCVSQIFIKVDSKQKESTNIKKALKSGNHELIIECKTNISNSEFIVEVLANKKNLDSDTINTAINKFEDMTAYEKENTLKSANNEVFNELLSYMSNTDFLAIGNETFANACATKMFKEGLEEARKESLHA